MDECYTCLSYECGTQPVNQLIIIDNAVFTMQRNLQEFLHNARTKFPLHGFESTQCVLIKGTLWSATAKYNE